MYIHGAVHEYGLHQYERARKLHWTLYGWATIAHCGLKLMTSTVQMIVLLQFNTFEVGGVHCLPQNLCHTSTVIHVQCIYMYGKSIY